jgi:hypothetical protein
MPPSLLRHASRWAAVAACGVVSGRAVAQQASWVDARATMTAQVFQQALLPGPGGVGAPLELALPVMTTAFLRFGAVDLPGAPDALGGELSAWGRLGPRDGWLGDGDVTTASAQLRTGRWRLTVGRQVTLPGTSRFVRFDGVTAGVRVGAVDVDAYAGWVALPRWSLPRGAWVLGFLGEALEDPRLREAQNRAGQLTAGARVGLRAGPVRALVGFHEQRDAVGLAVRAVSADVQGQPLAWLALGGHGSLDLTGLAVGGGKPVGVSEARLFADVVGLAFGTASLDYSFQNTALLLPQTSVLAAFGGGAWHEVGAELTAQLPARVRVTGRGAGQVYERGVPGGRGLVRARWSPGLEGRWLVQGELQRTQTAENGFHQVRVGARGRLLRQVSAAVDASLFLYDRPVLGLRESMTGVVSAEWAFGRQLRLLVSTTVLRTPYAAFEVQGLARLVFEWDPATAGGLP